MKIVAPHCETKTQFGLLSEGAVFRWNYGHAFMKTRQARRNDEDTVNAVDLETGCMKGFAPREDVAHLPNAKLVLGEQEKKMKKKVLSLVIDTSLTNADLEKAGAVELATERPGPVVGKIIRTQGIRARSVQVLDSDSTNSGTAGCSRKVLSLVVDTLATNEEIKGMSWHVVAGDANHEARNVRVLDSDAV